MQLILTPPPEVIVILKEISINCGNAAPTIAPTEIYASTIYKSMFVTYIRPVLGVLFFPHINGPN